jgi:hypothetical protein
MKIYRIETSTSGWSTYEVRADNEEQARQRFWDGEANCMDSGLNDNDGEEIDSIMEVTPIQVQRPAGYYDEVVARMRREEGIPSTEEEIDDLSDIGAPAEPSP